MDSNNHKDAGDAYGSSSALNWSPSFLSWYQLKDVPLWISNLSRLVELQLDGNPLVSPYSNLREVHGELSVAKLLTETTSSLNLSSLGLTDIPMNVLSQMQSIRELNLNDNLISGIPPGVSQVQSINFEFEAENACFSLIWSDQFQVDSLTSLMMDHNQLCNLPEDLFRHVHLQSFSCLYNNLRALACSPALSCPLENLNLASNSISSMAGITNLTNLKTLTLRDNHLTYFPEDIGEYPS